MAAMAISMIWIRNTLRNKLQSRMLGRALGWGMPSLRHIRIVSATRMAPKDFWKTSALGRSLSTWRADARLTIDIAFENAAGLPHVYNAAIARANESEALVFVHDDVWLNDPQWIDKVLVGLNRFDVLGVAGNRRRLPRQPTWLHTDLIEETQTAVLDALHLSGSIAHGAVPARAEFLFFGTSPAACELLDGVFLALRADVAHRSGAGFDERFSFHFYDLDFCRAARSRGVSIGTWPIELVHQSKGRLDDAWRGARDRYFEKWGT